MTMVTVERVRLASKQKWFLSWRGYISILYENGSCGGGTSCKSTRMVLVWYGMRILCPASPRCSKNIVTRGEGLSNKSMRLFYLWRMYISQVSENVQTI